MTITDSRGWANLDAHCHELSKTHLRDLFANDGGRVEALSLSFENIFCGFLTDYYLLNSEQIFVFWRQLVYFWSLTVRLKCWNQLYLEAIRRRYRGSW